MHGAIDIPLIGATDEAVIPSLSILAVEETVVAKASFKMYTIKPNFSVRLIIHFVIPLGSFSP